MPNHLPTNTSRFVSISEAAGLLGVSVDTIRRWDKAGVISSVRLDGKNRYFSLDEIQRVQAGKKLSISEAAEYLHISVSTLRRIEKRGLIQTSRNANGEREYDKAALDTYLAATKNQPVTQTQEAFEEGGSTQAFAAPGPVIGHATVLPPLEARVVVEDATVVPNEEPMPTQEQPTPRDAASVLDQVSSPSQTASNISYVDHISDYQASFADTSALTFDVTPQPVKTEVIEKSEYEEIEQEERPAQIREELFRDRFVASPQVSFSKDLPGVPTHQQDTESEDDDNYQTASLPSRLRSRFALLGLGTLMVISASTVLFGLTTLQSPATLSKAVSKTGNPAEVLAATTANLYDRMAFNIKTLFRADVIFDESITVGADSVFKGNVTLEDTNLDAGQGTVTASNLLYSIVAGSGVTISGDPQNPTISAGGVTSFQGTTGAVTLTAGSGVSISGTTITNSDTGSSQKIFGKVKVGSDTISAGNNTDTLELTAGTGISLSADTSNKKITINSTGSIAASGWTDGGTDVYLTTTSDNVGIGTTTPTEKLTVSGNVAISGNIGIGGDSINDFTGNGLVVSSNQLLVNVLGSADGASATTSSYSGLEFRSGALTMLQGCADDQILKWDDGLNLWVCANDAGGATAVINIKEGATTYTGNDTLTFNSNDFSISQAGSEATIAIDYANSFIARTNQNESISGSWTFSNATPFSISNTGAVIPIGDGGSLRFSDGANTLLTLTDAGSTGNLAITGVFTGATDETINGIDISAGTVSDVVNLTINSGGDLTIGSIGLNDTGTNGVTSGASLVGVFDQFTNSNATTVQGVLADFDSALGTGSSKWDILNGAITPRFSSTLDLLIGGTSTASAKFAFINVNNGTPVASISAGNTGATYITADGSIATTAKQSLNLGNSSTGNVIINGTTIVSSLGAGVVHSNAAGVLSVGAVTNAELQNSSITFNGDSGNGAISLGGNITISGGTGLTSSYSAGTLTINGDDATTGSKGIASFAAANFDVSSGAVSIKTDGVGATELASTTVTLGTYGNANNGIGQFTVDADGRITSASNRAVALGTADVTGTLTVNRGGTGVTTFGGANTLLYTTAADTLASLATANNGVLITNGTGVPSISSTLPTAVQGNITSLGTVTSGVWNGTAIGTQYGGTGQNWSAVAQGSLPYFSAAGVMNTLAPSTAGFILSTNGAGANPSWIDASSVGTNYWQQLDGGSTLLPKYATVADLLLGGTSTSSAKFAVLNMNAGAGGTPTASVSSGLNGNNGIYLTADGWIGTTNKLNLTLGTATTGSIILNGFGTGVIQSNTSGALSSAALNLAGGASYVSGILPVGNGGTGVNASGVLDGQILIGNDGANGFSLATLTAGTGISISNSAGGITISQTGSGASKWTQNGGVLFPNYASVADLLLGGTSTSSAKFAFINNLTGTPTASISANAGDVAFYMDGLGNLGTTNKQNLTLGTSSTGGIVLNGFGAGIIKSDANGLLSANATINIGTETTGTLAVGRGGTGVTTFGGINTLLYTTAADTLASLATANNGVLVTDGTGIPSIGSTLPNAVQDNITRLGTITQGVWNGTAIGTQYGGTGQNWSGVAQGSIPYFSAAGVMNTLAPSTAGFVLSTNGAGANPSWIDASSVGTNYWQQFNGGSLLTPKFASVADLLLGGTSTSSAKIGFLNINSGTPTASIAGTTANSSLYLTGNGSIATTNRQTLSLGGSGTGDIDLLIGGGNNLRINGTAGATVASAGCVTAVNGLVTGTASCQTGTEQWDILAGALVPKQAATADLLLGGTATASAKFAVLNITNGTPVASVSSGLNGNNGLYLTADGTLATTNKLNLTLGSSSTGSIILNGFGSGVIQSNASGALSSAALNLAGGASYITGTLPVGNGGTGATSFTSNGILYGNNTGAISVTAAAANSVLVTDGSNIPSLSQTLPTAVQGNITSLGTITSGVWNGTAIGTQYGGTGQNWSGVAQGSLPYFSAAGVMNTLAPTTAGFVLSTNGAGANPSWIDPASLGTNYWNQLTGGSVLLPKFASVADLLLGGTSTSSAKIGFININNGTPTASLSGTVANSSLYITGDGSLATTNRQTLTIGGGGSGNINLSLTGNSNLLVNGTPGLTQGSPSCVTTNNGIVTGFGACQLGSEQWVVNSGSIYTGITSLDLLLGGTSTASARFAVLNMSNGAGTPTASISAASGNNALSLAGDGTIATTNKQNLTFGGSTTGSIFLSNAAFANAGFTIPSGQSLTIAGITGNNAVLYGTASTGVVTSATTNSSNLCLMSGASNPTWAACPGSGSGASKWTDSGAVLYPNNIDRRIGIGTSTAGDVVSSLYVTHDIASGALGKALGIFNQTEDQDLLTASASGATRFAISNNGSIRMLESAGSTYFGTLSVGDLTNNVTYTLPMPGSGTTPTICLDTGNCAGSGGGITGSGTATQLAFFTGGGTIGSDSQLFFDNTNKRLGIGTSTPFGKLSISGLSVGQALVQLNETGDQDILVGSASGSTVFSVGRTGNLAIAGQLSNLTGGTLTVNDTLNLITGNTYQINGTDVLSSTTLGVGVTGSSLTSVGTLTSGTWNATAIGAQYGGTGINTSSSTGVPSISSGTWSVNANLATALGGLGADVTAAGAGELLYSTGATTYDSLAAGNAGYILQSNGAGAPTWVDPGTIPASNYWQQLFGGSVLTPRFASVADLLLGGTSTASAKIGLLNINSGTPTASISANAGNNATYLTGLGNLATTNGQTLTIGGASTGELVLSPRNSVAGSYIIPGANNTVDLGLSTAAFRNIYAGTNIYVNGSAVCTANGNNCPAGATTYWDQNNGALTPKYASVADLLLGGSATSSAKFAVLNINAGASGTPTASVSSGLNGNNGIYLTADGWLGTTNKLNLTLGTATTGSIILNGFGSGVIQSNASGALSSAALNLAGGASYITGTLPVGNGGTGATSFTTNGILYGNNTGALSVTAAAANSVLVTDGSNIPSLSQTLPSAVQGNITTVGTIGTGVWQGSVIGTTYGGTGKNLTMSNGGIVWTDADSFEVLNAGTAGYALVSGGAGTPSWVNPESSAFGLWNLSSGTYQPKFASVADLLLGGTSTSSAKIGFLNINSGTPTASVSSGLNGNNGIYLTADGTLATTNKLNLTLGSASTGSIGLFGFNTAGVLLNNASGVISSTTTLGPTFGGTGFGSYAVGDLLYADTTTSLAKRTIGSSGQVLTVSGGVPTWVDPASAGLNYWDQLAGALRPKNATVDLLLGGTSTASAKFAFINNTGSGTPTASISANSGANTSYLTGAGVLGTTNKQSLTLGSTTTGNLLFAPGGTTRMTVDSGGNVGIGTTAPQSLFAINTPITADVGTAALIAATNAGTKGLVIQGYTSQSSDLQQWQDSNGNALLKVQSSGLLTAIDSTSIASYANSGGTGDRSASGTVAPDVATNKSLWSGTLNNILDGNQNADAVQFWSNLADGDNTNKYIRFDFFTPKVVTESTWFMKGLSSNYDHGTWKWQGSNDNSNWTDIGGNFTLSSQGSGTVTQVMTQLSGNTNAYQYYRILGISGHFDNGAGCCGNFFREVEFKLADPGSNGNTNIAGGFIGIGTDTLTHKFNVSGSKVGKALSMFNETGGNDIIVASQGGTTKFIVGNTGNLQFAGSTSFLNTLTSAATAARTYTFPDASGTICLSTNNCAANSIWNTGSGSIFQGNVTQDLLLGGTSTSSAKFAFINTIGSGTPTASVSSGLNGNNGIYLTATGTLATTNKLNLTLGGTTTGNIVVNNTVLPGTSDTYTLGNTGSRFQTLFVSGGSVNNPGINLRDSSNNQGYIYTTTGNALVLQGATNITNLIDASGNFAIRNNILSQTNFNMNGEGSTAIGVNLGSSVSQLAGFSVSGNYKGNALAILNQTGAQDIFVASQAGTTRFRIANSGDLLPGTTNAYDIGASGTTFRTGYFGTDLVVGGSSVCRADGTNCPAGATTYWDQFNGAIRPKYASVTDLLLGGTSTSSAKFAVLNMNNGTPTASISANSGDNALFIDGLGNIATTNMQNLTLGNSSTGNVILNARNVGIGTTNPLNPLQVTGVDGAGSNLSNGVHIGMDTGGNAHVELVVDSGTPYIDFSNDNVEDYDARLILTNDDEITLQGTSKFFVESGNVGIGSSANDFMLQVAGNIGPDTTNTYDLGSSGISFKTGYFGTDVIVGGQSVCLANGTNCPTGAGNYWDQLNGGSTLTPKYASVADLLLGGTSTASAKFAFKNVNSGTPVASISANSNNIATYINGLGFIGTTNKQDLTFGGADTGNIVFAPNGDVAMTALSSGNVGIGTSSPLAKLHVNSNSGTPPLRLTQGGETVNDSFLLERPGGAGDAFRMFIDSSDLLNITRGATTYLSLSSGGNLGIGTTAPIGKLNVDGQVNGKALSILNYTGSDQNILVGSSSGATRFAFDRNGGLTLGLASNTQGSLVLANTSANSVTLNSSNSTTTPYTFTLPVDGGTSGYILTTNGSGVTSWLDPGTLPSSNYWDQLNSGSALTPKYASVADLLLGGTSTASAKFAVLNMNSGTPAASISGNSTNIATYLDGTGKLATTNRQNLTLGDSTTTGNVIINPAGIVGIGTTTPQINTKLHIDGGTDSALTGGGYLVIGTVSSTNLSLDNNEIMARNNGGTADLFIQNDGGNTIIGDTSLTSRVGIGVSNPVAKLDLNGQINGKALAIFNYTGSDQNIFVASSSGTAKFVIDYAGRVGVGTSTPLSALHVSDGQIGGRALAIFDQIGAVNNDILTASAGGATKFTIANNGNITATSSATTFNAFSFAANNLTTGNGLNLTTTGTGLTSGSLLNVNSTSNFTAFTGSLGLFDWSPTSSTTATGDLLTLNLGSNGNLGKIFNIKDGGSSVFSVSETAVETSLPVNFTSPGDVAIAYDLNFTNPTASYINSDASLYLRAGKVYNSDDLTLQTYNLGSVILDTSLAQLTGGMTVNGQYGGNALFSLNQTASSQDIFTASASGTTKFTLTNGGNIGFAGNTSFINTLTSAATAARTYTFPDASGTICLSTNNCSASSIWNTNLGAIFPGNTTQDLLLGGTATSSARFAVLNMTGSGAPTASIAGNLALAVPTTAGDNLLNLYNGSNLNIQSSVGGDAGLSGNSRFFLRGNTGNIGIGTTTTSNARVQIYNTTGTVPLWFSDPSNNNAYFTLSAGTFGISSHTGGVVNPGGIFLCNGGCGTTSNRALTIVSTGNVGIGGSGGGLNSPATLFVAGQLNGARSAVIVDQLATGTGSDILTGSASGSTRFVFSNSGNLSLGLASNTQGGLTLANTSANSVTLQSSNTTAGAYTFTLPTSGGTNGYILTTNGSGVTSWLDPGTLPSSNFWDQLNSGSALTPKFASVADLLLGGTSTSSAKFAVINMNNGTPVASVSATGVANRPGLSLGGDGTLQSLNMGTLTVGGSTTGNIVLSPLNNGLGGAVLPGANSVTTLGTSTNRFRQLFVSGNSYSEAAINFDDGSGNAGSIATLTGGMGFSTEGFLEMLLGNNNGTSNFRVTSRNDNIQHFLVNDTGATSIGVGVGQTGTQIGGLGVTGAYTGKALTILNQTGDQAIFTASQAGATKFIIANNGNVGVGTISPSRELEVNGTVRSSDGTFSADLLGNSSGPRLNLGSVATPDEYIAFGAYNSVNNLDTKARDLRIFSTADTTGLTYLQASGNFGIGTTSPIGKLNVNGQAVGKALTILNQTGNQDIFTASQAGATKFTIANNGQVLGVSGSAVSPTYTFASDNTTGLYLLGSQKLSIAAGGGAMATFDGTVGSVGIGTTTPTLGSLEIAHSGDFTGLAIHSTATDNPTMNLRIAGTGATPYGVLEIGDDSAWRNLALSPSGGNVGIGTTAAVGKLNVNGQVIGKALSIFNYTGSDQNILVGSSSGSTRFAFDRNGGLTLGLASSTQGSLVLANTSANSVTLQSSNTTAGAYTFTLPTSGGTNGYILTTNGSGVTSWLDPGTLPSSNFWDQLNSGSALTPKFASVADLLLGGTSTSSAKFAVLNMNHPTNQPTASVSGGLNANNGIYLTADGNISATNRKNLVIGNSSTYNTTGNILLNPSGGGNIGIGTTAPNSLLYMSGTNPTLSIAPSSGEAFINMGAVGNESGYQFARSSTGDFVFDTQNASYQFFINDGGNVGIGTGGYGSDSSADYTLELYSAAASSTFGMSDSDIAHGVTGIANTDTWFNVAPISGTDGGAYINAFSDAAGAKPFELRGIFGNTDPTDTVAALSLSGARRTGTSTTTLDKAETVLQVNNNTTPLLTMLGSGALGLGTTSPLSVLHVSDGNIGGRALAIFDQVGAVNNDILTASAGGVTKFTLANNGNITATSSATTFNAFSFAANNLTTGNGLNLTTTTTGLTSGNLLNVNSNSNFTAFTGSLGLFDWSPTSSTTATGDLLTLNLGANGNLGKIFNIKDGGTSVFSVSETAVETSLPVNFTSPGDVAISYDLNFTNPTASYINSSAPLYIRSGEVFNSSDMNLQTYNNGNVVIDSALTNLTTGGLRVSGQYGGHALVALNQTASQDIFTASASGTTRFLIKSDGNVGIGTGTPIATAHISGLKNGARSALIIDQLATGTGSDLFTASAAGTTKFSLSNSGELRLFDTDASNYSGFKANGTTTQNSVYTLPAAFPGGNGYVMTSQTDGTLGWLDPGSLPSSWQEFGSGSLLAPRYASVTDLVLGGTSTSSAKISFTNMLTGNPTLTVKDSTATKSISLYHDGTNANLTVSSGNLVLGSAGSMYLEADILNDTANNGGFVKIADRLNVEKDENAGNALAIFNNTGAGQLLTASASGTTRFTVANDGTTFASNLTGGATTLSTDANGNIIRTPSDANLKTNISSIVSALDKVMQLQGRTYNWKDTQKYGPQKEIGFIAQELEQVVPEVVSSGGAYKSVNYGALTSLLAEAVKEVNLKVENTNNQMSSLQNTFNQIAPEVATVASSSAMISQTQDQVSSLSTSLSSLSNGLIQTNSRLDQLASASAFMQQALDQVLMSSSQSASLAQTLNDLSVQTATVSGDLMVLGRTTVSDLGVTGNITAGVMSINGLDGEISTIGEPLKLQAHGLYGIEMVGGKVTVATNGDVTTVGKVTATKVETKKLIITSDPVASGSAVLNASVGVATIPAGATSIDVKTSALTAQSLIFTTPDTAVAVGTKKINTNTFRMTIEGPLQTNLKINWWIVDNKQLTSGN